MKVCAKSKKMGGFLESGYTLIKEQKRILEIKLAKEYMKNIDN